MAGYFEKPVDVAWDSKGNLLVLDDTRIQVFSETGQLLREERVKETASGILVSGLNVLLCETYSLNKHTWRSK